MCIGEPKRMLGRPASRRPAQRSRPGYGRLTTSSQHVVQMIRSPSSRYWIGAPQRVHRSLNSDSHDMHIMVHVVASSDWIMTTACSPQAGQSDVGSSPPSLTEEYQPSPRNSSAYSPASSAPDSHTVPHPG